MTSDAELLRRYAAMRDEAAFAELVQRHVNLVYRAALRQLGGDPHRAQEAAQLVFTLLARRAGALARHPSLAGWLYTTTHFTVRSLRRDERRRQAREQEAFIMHEFEQGARSDGEWERLRPVLDDAMQQLGERDRIALLARFFEAHSFSEIGAHLALSEDAARMRVERALEKIRGLLARRGVTSTGAALGLLLANEAALAVPAGMAASVAANAVAAAVAGGATSLAGAALAFMSSTKMVVGIAALAALGVGGAIYESRVATRSVAETAALRSEHEALRAKTAAMEAKLHAAERGAAAASTAEPAKPGSPDAASGKTAAPSESAAEAGGAAQSPWSKPDFARLEMEKFRAGLGLRYAPLYRALALNPDQIEKFEATLVEMQQGLVDIWTAAEAQGVSGSADVPAATSVARMTSDPLKRAEVRLEELLGEQGFGTYKNFSEAEKAREFVSSLAGAIYGSEIPLTGSQGEELARILRANTKFVKARMADDGAEPLYRFAEVTDWKAVEKQVGALLAPAQLKAFRALVEKARIEHEQEQVAQGITHAAERG